MARELISKEEANKRIEEEINFHFDKFDMTNGNNLNHLFFVIGAILLQTKTDEEIDDFIKKNMHKHPNKRKDL